MKGSGSSIRKGMLASRSVGRRKDPQSRRTGENTLDVPPPTYPWAWSSNLWGTLCPSKSLGHESEERSRKSQTSWGRVPWDTLGRLLGTSLRPLSPKEPLKAPGWILPCRAPQPSRAPPHMRAASNSRAHSATQVPLDHLGPPPSFRGPSTYVAPVCMSGGTGQV